MHPSEALALRHQVDGVRVFGSVLGCDDHEGGDLDFLVEPPAETSLMDIGAIRHELKQLLGLEVDVVTPKGIPAGFREQVLRDALPE